MFAERSPESDEDEEDMLDDEMSADDTCSDEEAPRTSARSEHSNFKQKIIRLLRRFKSSDDAEVVICLCEFIFSFHYVPLI